MSNSFLLALQSSFAGLLSPEAEVAVAVDHLIEDVLNWLSDDPWASPLGSMDEVTGALERLSPCSEKRILENTLRLLAQVVEQKQTAPAWQLVEYLRQVNNSLRDRELPLAA